MGGKGTHGYTFLRYCLRGARDAEQVDHVANMAQTMVGHEEITETERVDFHTDAERRKREIESVEVRRRNAVLRVARFAYGLAAKDRHDFIAKVSDVVEHELDEFFARTKQRELAREAAR